MVTMLMILLVSAWTAPYTPLFLLVCRGNFRAWWGSDGLFTEDFVDLWQWTYTLVASDLVMNLAILKLPLPMVSETWLPNYQI